MSSIPSKNKRGTRVPYLPEGITEFSFGYALTESIVKRFGVFGAPYFPNLRDEAEQGFDVGLDSPALGSVLLQFKVSRRMTHGGSKEFKHEFFEHCDEAFRMSITARSRSRQHDILVQLSEKDEKLCVLYAAPRFSSFAELSTSYMDGDLIEHTAFVDPKAIGRFSDERSHHVSFQRTSRYGICFSEPFRVKLSTLQSCIEKKSASSRIAARRRGKEWTVKEEQARLKELLLSVITEHRLLGSPDEIQDWMRQLDRPGALPKGLRSPEDVLDSMQASDIARLLLGCQLLIITEGHNEARGK